MKTKQKILLSAVVLMFSGAVAVHAAEEKAPAEKPAAEAGKKMHPHSHAVEKGTIPHQAASSGEAKEEHMKTKKKTHDHRKEMKGQ